MKNNLIKSAVAHKQAPVKQSTTYGSKVEEDVDVHAQARSSYIKRVVIVGVGETALNLAQELRSQGSYEIVGFVDEDIEFARQHEIELLGRHSDIENIISQYHIDEVFVIYYQSWLENLARKMYTYPREVMIRLVPGVYESMICRLSFERLNDLPVISVGLKNHCLRTIIVKRCFDAVMSLLLLILLSPIFLACAIAVKLSSPGPVFYKQERVGYRGKHFNIYKFRSMVQDAEKNTGPVLSTHADPRITTVGRFLRNSKFDELPQLINVLKGEMSFVGPRPERPSFVKKFEAMIPGYADRHRVKPGITGLAQAQGYYRTDVHTKLRYDLLYINHMTIFLDIRIFWLTFKSLIIERKE